MVESRLAYNYAAIDENNCCYLCRTYSYQIPLENFIPVPKASNEYLYKYYSYETGLWYYDQACTQVFDTSVL